MTDDVRGVSLCGALKNVVAVAAGFSDGLGWGNNAKAAIMRIGLMEMRKFSKEFFPEVRSNTFLVEVRPVLPPHFVSLIYPGQQSCGVAGALIPIPTSCPDH